MERPEPGVDAVDEDAGGPPPAGFVGHGTGGDHQGSRGRTRDAAAKIIGQRFAEEAGGVDGDAGPPEPLQREIAQAAAHRIADDERARQHRGRGRHAEEHGQVGAPVEADAAGDERPERHASVPPFIS